jgi:glucose/arabinose dehydrogenase
VARLASVRLLAAALCLPALSLPAAAGADIGAGPSTAFGQVKGLLPDEAPTTNAVVPSGFQETQAFGGLTAPIAVRFAADGRVFVAEQGGLIKVFDNLSDPTASIYADLRTNVQQYWDRGLLGMALDPQFTTGRPFVYVLYTHDAAIGGTAPRWGDQCPDPPGGLADGCVVSGRVSKLSGGTEQVLIEGWCQQYPSHSVGALAFGADGALYVSGGDGASFTFADYGQDGNPVNPCGDPPNGAGGSTTPPTAEGGALRSQDLRTTSDPTGLNGAILRVNPDTGAAMPDNPNAGSADANVRRIIAHGFRNPFRFAVRPGTNDLYIGDVGWDSWEEIDHVASPAAPVENFGWPCYEGTGRQPSYDNLNLNICENLYAAGAGAVTTPLYTYNHSSKVSTETCPTGGSSVSGLAFYNGGTFPSQYNGALFFADYSRNCIWVMFPDANGLPDPATRQPFVNAAAGPVDLQVGPGGALFYANLNGGTIQRIQALSNNHAPTADATGTPTSGALPLQVSFDGTGSTDPDGDALTYAWDLDGDGAFDDSTASKPSFTYATGGTYTVRLQVSDPGGLTGTDTVMISAGTAPTATIGTPVAGTTWRVGDVISFSGSATDGQGNPVPPSGLSWKLVMQHCSALVPTSCHAHNIQSFTGASGSFTAPDHGYPSYLELELTATAEGLSSTVKRQLDPKTVDLTFETQPAGLELSVGSEQQTAPFTRTVIQGSNVGLIAPASQSAGGKRYEFASWSHGGTASQTIVAPATPATYRATYTEAVCQPPPGLVGGWGFDEASGTGVTDGSGRGNNGTISGATRTTAGRFGSALTFDGVNDWVTVPDSASLDLSTRATLEAWVFPTALGGAWRTAVLKEQPGQLVYALYANNDASRPSGHLFTTGDLWSNGSAQLPLNAWSHLAMSWDGTTQRLYVNGTQVATRAVGGTLPNSAGALRFGGNSVWSEWFAGRLDEIRVYDRGLSQLELQSDMAAPVTCDGSSPPPPPQPALAVSRTSMSFTATQGGANPATQSFDVTNAGGGTLTFTDSESASWLSLSPASGTAPATVTASVSTAGLAPGTYTAPITVTAAGASGSPKTVDVTLTVNPATPVLGVAPTSLAFSATQGGANPAAQTVNVSNSGGGSLSFSTSDDQTWLAVAPASGTAPAGLSVSANIAGLAPGTYTGTVTISAAGASGSPKTVGVTLTVNPAPPPGSAPVGAWGFDETSGTGVTDGSGRGNNGTISGAVRTTAGRFGSALTFDGLNDWVTVPDSASLDLSTRATLEAWIFPTALGNAWRTAVIKEQPGQLVYALYANNDLSRPSGHLFTTGDLYSSGTAQLPLNAWSHLAMTWDGTTQRLYLNGGQVASRAVGGTLPNSAGALRFGGNAVWSEWFAGRLDEIRIYDRTLTQQELQSDMTKPVTASGLAAAQRAALRRSAQKAKVRRRAHHGRRIHGRVARLVNPGAHPRFRELIHTAR